MIEQISTFFNSEMIYLWLNLGILPFWFILIFFPQSRICNFFVTSIFPFLILGSIYIYLIYQLIISEYNFLSNFDLYLGLDELSGLLTDTSLLIIFWLHYISINLFCGSWIVRDSQKFMISKILIFFPLIITYFAGSVGILIYWLIRIFFAKRISLYD